ncbi:unnamed protein product [Lampetra fluviatilis]
MERPRQPASSGARDLEMDEMTALASQHEMPISNGMHAENSKVDAPILLRPAHPCMCARVPGGFRNQAARLSSRRAARELCGVGGSRPGVFIARLRERFPSTASTPTWFINLASRGNVATGHWNRKRHQQPPPSPLLLAV